MQDEPWQWYSIAMDIRLSPALRGVDVLSLLPVLVQHQHFPFMSSSSPTPIEATFGFLKQKHFYKDGYQN
jgi:hypothetical protein